jgi:hypothetical protein
MAMGTRKGRERRGLSDIRNHIEHKYLRVTIGESPTLPPDDLALTVSREQFEGKTLHLMRLARSALIYLAIGVGMEERGRMQTVNVDVIAHEIEPLGGLLTIGWACSSGSPNG